MSENLSLMCVLFCANIVYPNIIYLSFYQKYTFTLQLFRYFCNMITSKPDNTLD